MTIANLVLVQPSKTGPLAFTGSNGGFAPSSAASLSVDGRFSAEPVFVVGTGPFEAGFSGATTGDGAPRPLSAKGNAAATAKARAYKPRIRAIFFRNEGVRIGSIQDEFGN